MAEAKTALITGITGQDGSFLADLLLAKGYRVIGLARRSTNYDYPNIRHLIGKVTLEYGDLIDSDCLNNLIATYQPDEVYNIAAQSVPADSWKQPIVTAEVTGVGVIRLLEAVRRHKPDARFYQATSREIFGGVEQEVCDESTPLMANNPYGIAKQYAHLMTMNYRESYGMFACGGILFNHESERRSLHFVTRKVTMGAACIKLNVKHPPLNEAGEALVQDGKLKIGNLDDAFECVGLNWEDHVVTDERFVRPTEIAASRGDYSRAKADLNWEPRTSFEGLIQLMVEADMKLLAGWQ
jgi:GDPmannose 4,6-dehydratase